MKFTNSFSLDSFMSSKNVFKKVFQSNSIVQQVIRELATSSGGRYHEGDQRWKIVWRANEVKLNLQLIIKHHLFLPRLAVFIIFVLFCHHYGLIHLVFRQIQELNSRPRTMAQTVSPQCSPLDQGASLSVTSLYVS